MFQLRQYQEECLGKLTAYLRRARELNNADTAFYEQTRRQFRHVPGLEGLPYVCMRVPTGGGKTVMAAHAVKPAVEHWLQRERGIVLWLAPTTKIVDQTIGALRNRQHPYREALDRAFEGQVTVCDLEGALGLNKETVDNSTVVIVTTFAGWRVEELADRKVFRQNSAMFAIMRALTAEQRQTLLEGAAEGEDVLYPCLVNILRAYRPIVIVDEAHNFRTPLSFTVLKRFSPSCIIEFTATPQKDHDPARDLIASNVLHAVSAAELKDADMIKLPVMLRTRGRARDAVGQAIDKRNELEELAKAEEQAGREYVRPIVLYHAQSGDGELNPDGLKKLLVDELHIPREQVAICTGSTDELPDEPILSRNNPVRHIITIQKLREGWDCPFAYVLCSVSNLSSRTAVEQMIGRVLRMPHATRRGDDALNRAYTYATSEDFQAAAKDLEEAIVESGFTRFEARRAVQAEPDPGSAGGLFGGVQAMPVTVRLSRPIDVNVIPDAERQYVTVAQTAEGARVTWQGPAMSDEAAAALRDAAGDQSDQEQVERLRRRTWGDDASPAAMGKPFRVPGLAVKVDGQWELLDDQPLEADWDLSQCEYKLSESEFSIRRAQQQVAAIDVNKRGDVSTRFLNDMDRQILLFDSGAPDTPEKLARWLDQQIRDRFILPAQKLVFLLRVVEHLIGARGYSIEELARHRHRLKDAATAKINAHKLNAEASAYQHLLDAGAGMDLSCSIDFPATYPANRLCEAGFEWQKHYYTDVAWMNDEELEVAKFIDGRPEVEYWVRNLEREDRAFWLRLPNGKFFPDFIVKLIGDRYLVVEFKGGHLRTADDAELKDRIGRVWAAQSDDLRFCMVGKDDYRQKIEACLE